MTIEIKYGASKSLSGGFAPCVFVNGKSRYLLVRNTKTARGALNRAEKCAEEIAEESRHFGNDVTIKKWEHSVI
jgi:hypothetical protein